MKHCEIFDFLNHLYPIFDAMEFDNPGFLIGDFDDECTKALISLDCNLETVSYAKEKNCNLIITHHPVIFNPLKNILKGSVAYELIRNGISVISMHTNMDVGVGGVNDVLCKIIGLSNIAPHLTADGFLLKCGEISPASAENFANQLSDSLNTTIKYVAGGNKLKKILVCSGSGGEYLKEAIQHGFDALVTADIKHHLFLEAADNGIALFDAGHFATEDIIVDKLKQTLSEKFSECKFLTYHPNIIKFAY